MASVRVSMELVASSRIITGGSATAARAMASSCRWPWDRLGAVAGEHGVVPLGQAADEVVGIGQGGGRLHLFIRGIQIAVADVLPTVPVKRLVSWSTMPRLRRRSGLRMLLMEMPS